MAEPDQTTALMVRDLSVELAGQRVLDGVTFDVRCGELLAILGPNGAGKSTLLRASVGLLPYRGQVRSDGADVEQLSPAERARRISFVPQHSALSAALSVHEVVSLGRYTHRGGLAALRSQLGPGDRAAVAAALADTDASHLAERRFSDLSSGEQKRVLLARALCTEARTLLLDEPTSTLDIEHALRLFGLLRKLAGSGRAIVLVLHQLEHALAFCDRALLLSGGRVLALGATHSVLTPEHVLALHRVQLVPNGAPGFRLPEVL